MENHHFLRENPLFLWPFSIAMLVHQRANPTWQSRTEADFVLRPRNDFDGPCWQRLSGLFDESQKFLPLTLICSKSAGYWDMYCRYWDIVDMYCRYVLYIGICIVDIGTVIPLSLDWVSRENLHRKPWIIYYQISRGFRCNFSHHPIL